MKPIKLDARGASSSSAPRLSGDAAPPPPDPVTRGGGRTVAGSPQPRADSPRSLYATRWVDCVQFTGGLGRAHSARGRGVPGGEVVRMASESERANNLDGG